MSLSSFPVSVLGFAAFFGSGTTTLLVQLIPLLRNSGTRLALVKHSHHDFEMDKPGKDSHRLREAGAEQILLASPWRTAWIREGDGSTEPVLGELLDHLDTRALDLVLVEGFRHEPIPKIEIHRPALGTPLLCAEDDLVLALACDEPPAQPVDIPLLDLNDPQAIARWIRDWLKSA